jgi:hypothetical protein
MMANTNSSCNDDYYSTSNASNETRIMPTTHSNLCPVSTQRYDSERNRPAGTADVGNVVDAVPGHDEGTESASVTTEPLQQLALVR